MRNKQLFRYNRYLAAICLLMVLLCPTVLGQDFQIRKTKYALDSGLFERTLSLQELARQVSDVSKKSELNHQIVAEYEAIYKRRVALKDWEGAVTALIEKADIERRIYQDDTPYQTLKLARSLLQSYIPTNSFLWFRDYFALGIVSHRRADYYSAVDYLDSAQLLYNKATQYDSSMFRNLLEYKFYGYLYSNRSIDTLQKYIDIRLDLEKHEQEHKPDPEEMLYLLQDYPDIYSQKGEYDMALAYAISNYKYAIQNIDRVSNYNTYYKVFYDLALSLYRKGEGQKALKFGLEYINSKDAKKSPKFYINTIYLIGIIYGDLGDHEEAISYFDLFLKSESFLPDSNLSEILKANAILNLGINLYALGKIDQAMLRYHESLEKIKSIVEFPNPELVNSYRYLGDFYSAEEDWKTALINYDSALRNTGLNYSGEVLEYPDKDTTKRFSLEALTLLKKKAATMLKSDVSDPTIRLKTVVEYVDKTHEKLNDNRNDLYKTDGKLFLSYFFKDLYETGIEACYDLFQLTKDEQYAWKAFRYAQLSKSNLFIEQEKNYKELTSSNIPLSLKENYYSTTAELESLKGKLFGALDNSVTGDSVLRINDLILRLEARTDFLKDSIGKNYSNLGEIERNGDLLDNLERDQLLIEYFYGNNSIFSFAIGANRNISFKKLPLDDSVTGHLESFLNIISNPPEFDRFDKDFSSFRQHSFSLFNSLIAPLLSNRSEVDELIIVPDDFLTRIPFEALTVSDRADKSFKDLNYLIQNYRVRYLLTSNVEGEKTKGSTNHKILGIGFSETPNDVSASSRWATLPGTEREIQFLKARFDGDYYLGEEGSKENFLNSAKNYDIIHLAVHGKADSSNRFQSSLIFNGSDSILNPNQLYLANIQARLTVLSACESGKGQIESGEGTFSIARGFAIVGVSNIIMSLWEVNDRITSSQMVNFYSYLLKDGYDLNESLRKVKLNYIAESDSYSSHPYFWASFIHLGEDDSFASQNNKTMHIIISVIILLTLSFIVFKIVHKKRKGIR